MKYHFWLRLRDICREDDAAAAAAAAAAAVADAEAKAAAAAAAAAANAGKTFTQDEVNTMLAKERRADQARAQEQLRQLEAIKQDGLTPETKAALEAQMEALRAQSQTEAELSKQQLAKVKREAAAKEKELTTERDAARVAFERLQIDTLLSTALGIHGVKPTAAPMLSAFLQNRLQRVPVLGEDGKATGQHRFMINLEEPDGDAGKTKILQLTPDKAVAHLREGEAFSGLFTTTARSGMGGQNAGSVGLPDVSKMSQDEYMKQRAERRKAGVS